MNDFLPQDYEIPKAPSKYTRFEKDTTTRLRILPSGLERDVILFNQYFDKSTNPKGIPVRSIKEFESTPWIMWDDKVKAMWAVKVWNYDEKIIQIWDIGQKTIQTMLQKFAEDEDYWSPVNYDIKLTKDWDGLESKYSIMPGIIKDFNAEDFEDVKIDWSAYLACEENVFLDN